MASGKARLVHFEVLAGGGGDTRGNATTSAPLLAPLSFCAGFQLPREELGAMAPGDAPALCVAVDFVADVASEKTTMCLLPLTLLHSSDAVGDTAAGGCATLTTSAAASASQSTPAVPHTDPADAASLQYLLTVHLADLGALSEVQLKHLLQVSMMTVRLVHVPAATAAAAAVACDEHKVLANWNVVWQVRRNPQNEKELVRTVLSPVA